MMIKMIMKAILVLCIGSSLASAQGSNFEDDVVSAPRFLKKKGQFCNVARSQIGIQCGTNKNGSKRCECTLDESNAPQCVLDDYSLYNNCKNNKGCPKGRICWSGYCMPLCPKPLPAKAPIPACKASTEGRPCGLNAGETCTCNYKFSNRNTHLCTTNYPYQTCDTNANCPEGQCIEGMCKIDCTTDANCARGRVCMFNHQVDGTQGFCDTPCKAKI
ncbi:hypothetical protein IV203_025589 [Nitzschia inconspicua]|uniref:Uncharacterized protein n=1 Tax=Nitzschia inconspicua TaxID=303405 RepID=A0A9K3LHT1_9STRA|nr:hypothetical protein IV203_025589 [Nitzschia inconspicua]